MIEEPGKAPPEPEKAPSEPAKAPPASRPRLAVWFWGTILVMAGIVIILLGTAALRQEPASPEQVRATTPIEMTAAHLESLLTTANRTAVQKVVAEIGPLVDAAYQPAYDAIPAYASFHYSVWGEYTELTIAAIGVVSSKLDSMVLAGLGERLDRVGMTMNDHFASAFEAELATVKAANKVSLGTLTTLTMDSLYARMKVTLPVGAATSVGVALVGKNVAKIIAYKIAQKLALKVLAKTSTKWTTSLTAGGSGAALCSWSGPGAAVCGIVGGITAWIVTDYTIVKLDEYWTRDEFEADLRLMLDEQKAAQKEALKQALLVKATALQHDTAAAVQVHAFKLRELYGQGNAETCRIAADLLARYAPLRQDLRARTPESLQSLRATMAPHLTDLVLGPLVREISTNLQAGTDATVAAVHVEGDLPVAYRADADVSGILLLDGHSIRIFKVPAKNGFTIDVASGQAIKLDRPLTLALSLEQHLLWERNPYFGTLVKDASIRMEGKAPGLRQFTTFTSPLARDPDASSVQQVNIIPDAGEAVRFTLDLRAAPLPDLHDGPACP